MSYKKNHKTIIKALVIVISEHFELFWYLYKQKSYGRLKYASFFKIDLEVQTLTGHISVTGGQRNLKFCIHWFLIRIYLFAKFEENRSWWLPFFGNFGRDQLNLTHIHLKNFKNVNINRFNILTQPLHFMQKCKTALKRVIFKIFWKIMANLDFSRPF